ncbi:MAG TPA: cyclic nucleotide-binding domain-containing protein [Chitinophagaceae bacterium]|nr:cyclic nucleotide-binding domain-containing protein [Chitinophagaceae bacterium]
MMPEMLREIPLFATLSPQELEELLKQLEKVNYPPNTVIFWMDEPGDKLYVIEKGQVRISYSNKEGKEIVLTTLGENAFFGELSLLDGGPHTATARTARETTLLTIDKVAFYSFLDKHPQFSQTLLTVLVDRLRTSTMNMRQHLVGDHTALPQPASFRRSVDKAARFVSSSRFLLFAILFLIAWMGLQSWLYFRHHDVVSFADNPPTFTFLEFILTITSFLFTILVLTSQRGLAEHDRVRSEIEYQVNLKAQSEVMRLQLKMDEVLKLLEEKASEKKMP